MTTVAELSALPRPPTVGMPFLTLLRTIRDFHTAGATFRDTVGPVTTTNLGPFVPKLVWVSSTQGAHDVLANHDGSIDKHTTLVRQLRLLGGESVFSLGNESWKPRRRTLQPLFTKQHVEHFTGHMAGAARHLASAWPAYSVIDIDAESRHLTLRVLGRSLFGLDLDADAERLGPPIREVLNYTTARAIAPVRLPVWVPTPGQRRWSEARAVIWSIVDAAIANAHTHPGHAELLDLLFQAKDPDTGLGLTHEEIRSELTTFLTAGHDTTATTLSYALWQLGRNADLQTSVAAEALALGERDLTMADIPDLALTIRVLHEALRLCPPAAAVSRSVERDLAIDGYRVEAGQDIIVSIWALHRDPAIWGADADEFDPDRFLPEPSKNRDRWAYLPFGGGMRSCIGDHFAMTEAAIALATLVREVEFESQDDTFEVALPFTMTAAGPVPVRVRPRKRAAPPPPASGQPTA
ncbi:cytochrome P450 [Knoellia sp. S7-12]|uniref:cytochrome P450 n=1 Tax=Knoellia sp. S7-12 TaxID=3126698 RepID=UPI0033684CAA